VTRGFACIGLHAPTKEANIGGAMRAAYAFGASLIAIDGKQVIYPTDTPATYRHVPVIRTKDIFDVIPYDCVPVAVELPPTDEYGSCDTPHWYLPQYIHPERAFYIFGPENGSLGKSVLSRCRDLVVIPTKTCLNLAATVNVVLYDRQAKRG
jgi:tRNA(Leu) C34 or U34 (ribose-2'-O)-methylase TrmL